MKNEIGRKITSLTLMTIMVAGGMSFAVPGVMPSAYAANANLFVSAENSQFSNYMSGPQVIEVVVIDPDIDDTDEAKGEPDVTINGKIMRMVQAVDGNWYGYFADRNQALIADSTVVGNTAGEGLDFGVFCAETTGGTVLGEGVSSVDISDTVGIAVKNTVIVANEVQGTSPPVALTNTCTAGSTSTVDNQNVLREEKDVNTTLPGVADGDGQIGLDPDFWPFIQLYPLNPTGNVVIQYNKGGGAQTTTLTFDTVENFAGIELDRTIYPNNAQVHVTITDLWLNIDPTDEDSWTWDTNGTDRNDLGTFYQVFNENGGQAGALAADGVIDINVGSTLGDLMIEDNGILILTTDAQSSGIPVVTLQDNDDTDLTCTTAAACAVTSNPGALVAGSVPVTITELGPNSGIFGTYDESDTSNLLITGNALRGTSATIDYNETPTTILVGFDFATIDIQPIDDTWSSGEEIPLVLVDGDANKNSRADEDLDLNNPDVTLIPSLQTGSPYSLGTTGTGSDTVATAVFTSTILPNPGVGVFSAPTATVDLGGLATTTVQTFSQRALVTPLITTVILIIIAFYINILFIKF
ncbi:hypothetical protein LCGC14_1698790 [marine sediment metagenome]|uniref:Uncharacterized protein n=1 Tax=marine sediment metagenome TaxID=412755 RepID=A0A0F9HJ63_9ZZZZ